MYDCVQDPYSESTGHPENLTLKEADELCELHCCRTFEIKFTNLYLDKFWISVKEEFPTLHRKAINILLQFSTLYRCEEALSYLMTDIKSKDRNHLSQLRMKSVCVYLKFDLELSITYSH